jgi:hypothetical protein
MMMFMRARTAASRNFTIERLTVEFADRLS